MTRAPILLYPNPELSLGSDPVDLEWARSDEFKKLLGEMVDTMLHFRGLGLSAIQLGVQDRVFVMRTQTGVAIHLNPEIESVDGELTEMAEGCLSLPGVVEKVLRYPSIVISSLHIESGERKRYDLEGIEAQCAQHEIDHLDGKMFSDDYGPVKRDIARRKIRKQVRLNPLFRS